MRTDRFAIPAAVAGCLIGLLSIAGCAEKPPGYYEHEEDEFSLVLPEGWNMDDNAPGVSLVAWKGERDERAPTVTVVTHHLPPEATNENFADLNFREAGSINQAATLRDERIIIDGDTVTARVYAYQLDGKWRQAMLASIVSDDRKGYVLNCSSVPERFQGDRDEYMNILGSFKRE